MQINWSQSPPLSDERYEPDLGPVLPQRQPTPEDARAKAEPATEDARVVPLPVVNGAPSPAEHAEAPANFADISVGVRPVEPAPDAAAAEEHPLARARPSAGRRIMRTCMWFCIAVLIGVAGTLTVQSHTREVGAMVSAWVPFLKRPPAPPTESPPVAASEQTSPAATASMPEPVTASISAPATAASAPAAQVVPSAPPPPAAAVLAPETMQQLETIAHDLADLRHSVEELTAKQEQLAKGIAGLHATEQRVARKPPPARAAGVPPRHDAFVPAPSPRHEAGGVPPPRSAPLPPPPSSMDGEPPPARPPAPLR